MVRRLFTRDEVTPQNLRVLYEDNHLLAVLKPAGVLVQRDRSGDPSLMDAVKQYIKKKYGKPGDVYLGLVHRLDRPVSGVVLFARTSKAASRLSRLWRSRSVTKIYWALVHGAMRPATGTSRVETGFEGAKGVQEATLSYRTLRWTESHSLLEIRLHTGRKHQIRVQLAAAGCPIVGDVKYGAPSSPDDRRLCLTARSITFTHPTRGEETTIEAPLPEWASKFLPAAGKPAGTSNTIRRRG
jgi:23S rRNA pseudouridine1911/1915/1917 synthase